MLSVTFTTILTCSTRHEKKQILDHVIHDVLPVQKHISTCFGERHQNHCFLIVILAVRVVGGGDCWAISLFGGM